MIEAYTVEQIRAVEAAALARHGDGTLMRRASHAIALEVAERLPSPHPGRRVVLLVGSGNNGGDALYAGAFLRGRGMRITAVLLDPAKAHPAGLQALRRAGARVLAADDPAAATGITRPSTARTSSSTGSSVWPPGHRCARTPPNWSVTPTRPTRCGWRWTSPAGSNRTPGGSAGWRSSRM